MDKKLKTYLKPSITVTQMEMGSMLEQKSNVEGGAGSAGNGDGLGGGGNAGEDANFRGVFDEAEDWNEDNSLF